MKKRKANLSTNANEVLYEEEQKSFVIVSSSFSVTEDRRSKYVNQEEQHA